MNEFLKNLRNTQRSNHQRYSGGGSRKEIDGNFYPGKDRRKVKDRRTQQPSRNGNLSAMEELLGETIPYIQDNLVRLTSCLEKLTEQNQILVNAKLEQYSSMNTLINTLTTLLDEKISHLLDSGTLANTGSKDICINSSQETRHTKGEVIAMIKKMRKDKATFAEIAENLQEQGIPTFSGRGEWHAQTIHRLCKK